MNRRIEVTEFQREIKRKKRVIEYAEKKEGLSIGFPRLLISEMSVGLSRDRFRKVG